MRSPLIGNGNFNFGSLPLKNAGSCIFSKLRAILQLAVTLLERRTFRFAHVGGLEGVLALVDLEDVENDDVARRQCGASQLATT